MKKLLSVVLVLTMVLSLTISAVHAESADAGKWKIAILTGTVSQGE